MIKVLAIGDVIGRVGRRTVAQFLPQIRSEFNPDITLLNGENAAGGFGMTEKIYREFTEDLRFDGITMGNHWNHKKEIHKFLAKSDRMVLPANMSNVEETQGIRILRAHTGTKFALINLIGRAFMHDSNRSPFDAVSRLLSNVPNDVKIRIVDMHAEATSEKQGMGHFLRGKASLVYGTHTHVQTADERILADGTGYITDVGSTGPYDSIIGMRSDLAMRRMLTGERIKLEPAKDNPWLCALIAEIDEETGKCCHVERLQWKASNLT